MFSVVNMQRVEGRSEAAWAYDFAASASASELAGAALTAGGAAARQLFGALSLSYRGQSVRCVSELQHALENCESSEMRAVYADYLVGRLMYFTWAGCAEVDRIERLIEVMHGQGRDAEIAAYKVGIHFRRATRKQFDEMLATAINAASRAESIARARVLQRLAAYASAASRPEQARPLAVESLEISRRLGLPRTWSTSLKILGELEAEAFNDVNGLKYMLEGEQVATRFGDVSYAHALCGHVFNFAVAVGDEVSAERALSTFESTPTIDDHFEKRMIWLSRCLQAGWSDVYKMRDALSADAGFEGGHSRMYGLLAVVSASDENRLAADRYIRASLGSLDGAPTSPAGKRWRASSRLLVAGAHQLLGREALAQRQLATSETRLPVYRQAFRAMLLENIEGLPTSLLGVGQAIVSCVRQKRSASRPLPRGLTPAEFEVLKAVNDGATLREIAVVRRVSIETVKHQCSSINRKFETSRIAKAAAEARRFGWL